MERWEGKVAIVTGASSGIGAAISKALVQKGLKVIGLARRVERVEELACSLADQPGELFAVACDVTKEDNILEAFKWITDNVGPVHILINNAGLTKPTSLTDGSTEQWQQVFDVNVMALCICTRETIRIMKEYDINGHIVHMNSTAGHQVPNLPNFNVYPASKFAVTALTETLRQELNHERLKIKITVAGLARRIDRLQELASSLEEAPGLLYPLRCDITNEDSILRSFKWIMDNVGPVHILINNAGLSRQTNLTEGATDDWRRVFDVNVMALCICTREAVKIMRENNIAGHIIHMNSVAGHYVPNMPEPTFNVYPASKFAVTALTESLRQELRFQKSPIKITSISPGLVKSEVSDGLQDDGGKEVLPEMPALRPDDVADGVLYVLSTGPHVQVMYWSLRLSGKLSHAKDSHNKMERWEGKVAIVTGASAGIGPAVIKILVEKGLKVIGLARLTHRIQEYANNLTNAPGQLFALKCDIAKEDDILKSFKWVTEKVGPVHILINNAGVNRTTTLTDGTTKEWRRVFNVNVMALCICTREAIKIMKRYNISGHIIHMNSVTGHRVPNMPEPTLNVYPASKFAVTALTESLRQELRYCKSKIKVTSISPGLVRAEFQEGFPDDDVKAALNEIPALKPEDIAEAIIYVLSTGPNVQVHELTVHPLGELL
ncbi:dehydrogenase/reductase SDR family member 11-like [Asbolus verrucosus]|uniref:Dehydrogenase/reductase SDR family member 11-like n=1 Tax=Asbolus verrucosus TaxID=1661398 RepID=A0A482VWG2_ASBVE|nr:dehydrogenase/reductase SDR family member 11-like [Asbolus verrucosus]